MERLSLEQVKEIEKNILKEFDRYCCENGLKYCVEYGTLLGAIRHKGFIPWDDDIDVVMPLEEVRKLQRIFHKYIYGNDYMIPQQWSHIKEYNDVRV